MPRSTYVYAVMLSGQIAPLATFTVKNEMKRLLDRMDHESPSVLEQIRIYRMDDGPAGVIAEMTVADILK